MDNILKEGTSLNKTKLNLNLKEIDDEKIEIIIKYLSENTTIATLDLGNNKIGEECAKYLSNNLIGDLGAKYLSENSTITTLNLEYNKMGELGVKYLSIVDIMEVIIMVLSSVI